MKRKQIRQTVNEVGAISFDVTGSMKLVSSKTHEVIEIDLPSTLAIVRGTLLWVDGLFDAEQTGDAMRDLNELLECVGFAIGADLSQDEEEDE